MFDCCLRDSTYSYQPPALLRGALAQKSVSSAPRKVEVLQPSVSIEVPFMAPSSLPIPIPIGRKASRVVETSFIQTPPLVEQASSCSPFCIGKVNWVPPLPLTEAERAELMSLDGSVKDPSSLRLLSAYGSIKTGNELPYAPGPMLCALRLSNVNAEQTVSGALKDQFSI